MVMANENSRSPLVGRTALLTGASGGIGGALATRLVDEGADLLLSFATRGDQTQQIADYARERGRKVVSVQADLADPAAPALLADTARREFGAMDVLIANAGLATMAEWAQVDLDLWNTTIAVNLTAPFLLAQQLLPDMIDRGFGRILFVSSVAALNGGVVGPHYAASKAGLHGLVHHLAPRVARSGVTVNALAPALIAATRMLPVDPDQADPSMPIPVGRLGRPSEVAEMAITMLRNGYLTDKVIALDGGLLPR
jgi:3-oxoacyl-[acyl-carrier protein] reductase